MPAPTAKSTEVNPARMGVQPRPACMNRLQTRKNPPKPIQNSSQLAKPTVKGREQNRSISTSGEPMVRARHRSYTPKTAKTASEAAIMTKVQTGQSNRRPSVSGYTSSSTAETASAIPMMSSRGGFGDRESRITTAAATSPRMPTGIFTRKIGRQPRSNRSHCTSSPPSARPTAEAEPPTPL